MTSVDRLRQRSLAARERLRRIPATGPGELGAPDPETGERWNRGNILGHLAEMVPFWAGQADAVLRGATSIGRDEHGLQQRRLGVERGALLPEAELRSAIDTGLAHLDVTLRGLTGDDLERPVTYRSATLGERTGTLGDFLDDLLVGHLEGHLDQLESIT